MTGEDRFQTKPATLVTEATATGSVRYRFPVEVEVVGELGDEHARRIAKYVFERLDATLRSRG